VGIAVSGVHGPVHDILRRSRSFVTQSRQKVHPRFEPLT
jgi:hypothetical protein